MKKTPWVHNRLNGVSFLVFLTYLIYLGYYLFIFLYFALQCSNTFIKFVPCNVKILPYYSQSIVVT